MRQAIQTKYLSPTNYRGSRIKASCQAGTVTVGYDHALNVDDNHRAAAETLRRKLGWCDAVDNENYRGGQLRDGSCVWVEVES